MSAFASTASGVLPVLLGPDEKPVGETSFTLKDLRDRVSLAFRGVQLTSDEYTHCFGNKLFEYTTKQGKVKGWAIMGTLREAAEILQRRIIEDVGGYIRHSEVEIEPWIIRCVLLGRDSRHAAPYVVLICGKSSCRKALRAHIDQSHYLMPPWRCFTLPWNVVPLMRQSGPAWSVPTLYEPYEIYAQEDSVGGNINGLPIEIWQSGIRVGRATIGGIVRARNFHGYPYPVDLAMTVAHVFGSKELASPVTFSPPGIDDADSSVGVESDDENAWPEGDDALSMDSESAASRMSVEPMMYQPQPFREKVQIGSLVFMSGFTKELVRKSETPSGGLDWGLIALNNETRALQNKQVMALGRADAHSPGTAVTVLTPRSSATRSIVSSATFGLPGRSYMPQPAMAISTSSVEPGDSGSWVVHSGAPAVLGMLIGACPLLNEAYYIPFEQVLKDVERQIDVTVEIAPPTERRCPSDFLMAPSESERYAAVAHARGLFPTLHFPYSYVHEREETFVEHDTDELNFLETTRLILASKEGSLRTIEALLEEGVKVDTADKHGTALQHASFRGHFKVVKLLLEKGSDPNARDTGGNTALCSASRNGHIDIVRLLLKAQARSHISNNAGKSPLSLATSNYHLDVVALLVTPEAAQNFKTSSGGSLLHVAVAEGHLRLAKILVDNGAALDIIDNSYQTPLHMASRDGRAEMIQLFIASGANVNLKNPQDLSPLHLACTFEVARLLIQAGADLDSRNGHGDSPLLVASDKGYMDVVQFLLDVGANPSDTNRFGQSPLGSASNRGLSDVVNLLLSRGANPRKGDANGDTPLHRACRYGHLKVVKLLLDGGADAVATNHQGLTPLHRACRNGHLDVVRLLLDGGADASAANLQGLTPLHWASAGNRYDFARLLLDHGADPSAADSIGVCPIHLASLCGNFEVVRLLLNHSADPSAVDNSGVHPIHLASLFGNLEVVRLLVNHGADPYVARPPPDTDDVGRDPRQWSPIGIGQTPLHMAFEGGHFGLASLLVQLGADIYATDAEGRTPWDMPRYEKRFAHKEAFDDLRVSQAGGDPTPT